MKRVFATIFVVAFSLLLSLTSHADVRIVTVHAEGKCELSRFITIEQAEQKALQEAKQEALRKAGIPENVWSVFGTVTESDGQAFKQAYSEMSVLAIGGLVNILEAPTYTQEYNKVEKRTYVICKIHAEVKKGDQVDKSYQIKVDGISSVYKVDEAFSMNIQVSFDSYVRVFWFNESDGSQLLPNSYEQNHFLPKGTTRVFPNSELYDLGIVKNDPTKETEQVNVMVVATKTDHPFFEDVVSFESLLKWIYNIPASERCASFETFYIK